MVLVRESLVNMVNHYGKHRLKLFLTVVFLDKDPRVLFFQNLEIVF